MSFNLHRWVAAESYIQNNDSVGSLWGRPYSLPTLYILKIVDNN